MLGVSDTVTSMQASYPGHSSTPVKTFSIGFTFESLNELPYARAVAEEMKLSGEMVDEIVGQIERGEYQVSGADVAPKMIQEHLAYATE